MSTGKASVVFRVVACAVGIFGLVATAAPAEGGATAEKIEVLEGLARKMPHQPLSFAEVVETAGKEPKKLCQWVRDHIMFEPYRGFMRGGLGTLAARRGNAADRAMLLCELLKEAGVSAQLARGTAAAEQLPTAKLPPRTDPASPSDKEVTAFAAQCGLDLAQAKSAMAEAQIAREKFQEELSASTAADLEAMAAQLEAAGVAVPAAKALAPDTDHWWVHTEGGEFDPTLNAPPEKSTALCDLKDVPAEQFHQLALVVKIRKDKEDVVVLRSTLRTASLWGKAIVLSDLPLDALKAINALEDSEPAKVIDTLAAAKIFQPVLAVGEDSFIGKTFDLSGEIVEVDDKGDPSALGKGLGGLFGGGDEEEPKDKPKTELTACWLEMTSSGPGAGARTIRRSIFAKGVSARQRALDLIATREFLVMPEDVTEDFVTQTEIDYSAKWRDILADYGKSAKEGLRPSSMPRLPRFNGALYGFAVARGVQLDALCREKFGGAAYVHSRPTLASFVHRYVDAQKPKVCEGIDIIENELTLPGHKPAGWRQSFGLSCGVLDTALENVVMDAPSTCANASALWRKARLDGRKAVLARGSLPAGVQVSKAAASQIQGDLDKAVCIVIPGPTAAWYRVRLADGMTLGYVEGGGGQSMSEDVLTRVSMINDVYGAMTFYNDLFTCIAVGVEAPLAGDEGRKSFLQCAFKIGCGKTRDVVKKSLNVKTLWCGFIFDQALKQLWSAYCKEITKELFG